MNKTRRRVSALAGLMVVMALLIFAVRQSAPVDGASTTPTPYHEGFPSPMASPHAMLPTVYPLPVSEDSMTTTSMAAGGAAMIAAAVGMSQAAQQMIASDVPELRELGQHWAQDAVALQERGAWMALSASADSMVHDPARAHEVNLQNLLGNGLSMAAEGQAMVDHGNEMATEVERLRRDGVLSEAMAEELSAEAQALVAAGEALVRDGERMQDYAEKMLQSIGQ